MFRDRASVAGLCLAVLLSLLGCQGLGRHRSSGPDEQPAEAEIPADADPWETEPGDDAGAEPDRGADRDAAEPDPADADSEPNDADPAADADPLTCGANADCPCPGGICLDTGVCWCPPCETDQDCPAGEVCRAGNCVTLQPECLPPLRVSPQSGPTTGGTVLQVQGSEFYIGAQAWLVRIGDGPWLWAWDGAPCSLSALTPPMPAGTYPVHVLYGWPTPDPPPEPGEPAGSFTYVEDDREIGGDACVSALQCDPTWEYCDLGLGRCAPYLCHSLACPEERPYCDPLLGCQDPPASCTSDSDCKLIRSPCTCQAVPVGDPRDAITACALGACAECKVNVCDINPGIVAACRGGQCVERFADPEGPACTRLEPEILADDLQSGDWISAPRAARHGERAALVWTEPEGEPHYRYGAVRLAVVDESGRPGPGGIAAVDGPQPRASQAAVASSGEELGVVWMRESIGRELVFRRYDAEGSSILTEQVLDGPVSVGGVPWLFFEHGDFLLLWPVREYGADDGLHHAWLGDPIATADVLEWLVPQSGDLAVSRLGTSSSLALAWQSALYDLPGLYFSDLPRSGTPLAKLSGAGAAVALAETGPGAVALWRETPASGTQNRASLFLQGFHREGVRLSEPRHVQNHGPALLEPRVAYLGGVVLVQWLERDSWDGEAPVRLMAAQLDELGTWISGASEVLTAPAQTGGLFQVRLHDTVLSGYVERGANADTMRFVRWRCIQ